MNRHEQRSSYYYFHRPPHEPKKIIPTSSLARYIIFCFASSAEFLPAVLPFDERRTWTFSYSDRQDAIWKVENATDRRWFTYSVLMQLHNREYVSYLYVNAMGLFVYVWSFDWLRNDYERFSVHLMQRLASSYKANYLQFALEWLLLNLQPPNN